ncbi:MAG: NnrS family protein [Myxococcales bacterium]|nr:NnrS family protein [Myxococcales bacterium]
MRTLWATAFRPFFLAASSFAAVALGVWILALSGVPISGVDVPWHAHELLYGFFAAVLCGFLLTAAKNWASLPAVSGARLQVLFAVWVLGRVAALGPVPALRFVSVLTPVLLFAYLLPYLLAKGQQGNRVFLVAVALFALGDGVSLLPSTPAWAPFLNRSNGLWLGLHVAQWLIVLMSAKTMPLFVERAVGAPVRTWPLVERASSWSVLAALVADFLDAPAPVLVAASLAAAVANGVRLWGFRGLQGLRSRLLFLVVLGYGCLVAGYAGLAWVSWTGAPLSQVVHVFTAGAISAMVYSIMSRIALGHTGRPIAVSRVLLAGYFLVVLGAGVRIAAGAAPGEHFIALLQVAGGSLALAWGLYAAWSAPFLLAPRADGKPG